MAKTPGLPERPGYITRKSGYSNIHIKDVYAAGTGDSPLMEGFVDLSESYAKMVIAQEQKKAVDDKSSRAKAKKQKDDLDIADAEAWRRQFVGNFRDAVNRKDLHATKSPIWWQTMAEISGDKESDELIAKANASWAKKVQEGHPDSLDPNGYKSHINSTVGEYVEDNNVDNAYYNSVFFRNIDDHTVRSFGPQEAKSRERNFVKVSSEGIDFLVKQLQEYGASDDDGKKLIRGRAAKRMQQLYDMAVVNPVFMENLGKEMVDAIETADDPEAAEDFFTRIRTHGTSKLYKTDSIETYYNARKGPRDKAKDNATTSNNLRFWTDWDISLHTKPEDFVLKHKTRASTREESIKGLDDWYENQEKSLHEQFGFVRDDGSLIDYKDGPAVFQENRGKLEKTYQRAKSLIKHQQQLYIKTEPTMENLQSAITAARDDLALAQGAMRIDTDAGVIAGKENWQSLTKGMEEQVRYLVDPSTVTFDNPDGTYFTEGGAKKAVEEMVYQEFFVGASTQDKAVYAQMVGLNNAHVMGKMGQWMQLKSGNFVNNATIARVAPLQPGQSPWEIDPLERTLASAAAGVRDADGKLVHGPLPKDRYEMTREDVEGSDVLEAFEVFSHLRDNSINAKTLLALDEDTNQLFEDAWRSQGPSLSHKLVQSAKRQHISTQGGMNPLSNSAKKTLGEALEGYGVTSQHINIVDTALQSVWEDFAEGLDAAVAVENLEGWAAINVKAKKNSYLRIGSPNNLPEMVPALGLDEEGFFAQMASDIAGELGWPETDLETKGTSVVRNEKMHRTQYGKYRVELFAISMQGDVMVIPQLKDIEDGSLVDMLDYNIKTSYSGDDLKFLMEGYVSQRDANRVAIIKEREKYDREHPDTGLSSRR